MKPPSSIFKFGAVALALLSLALSLACGGDDKTEEEAASDLCSDLNQFGTSFAQLVSLDPDATSIGEFQDAANTVREDLDEVGDSAGDVARYNQDELETAYEDLDNAVEDIDEDDSLSEARGAIRQQITGVVDAWENAVASVPCEVPQRGGAD
jgi:hypothetical protein